MTGRLVAARAGVRLRSRQQRIEEQHLPPSADFASELADCCSGRERRPAGDSWRGLPQGRRGVVAGVRASDNPTGKTAASKVRLTQSLIGVLRRYPARYMPKHVQRSFNRLGCGQLRMRRRSPMMQRSRAPDFSPFAINRAARERHNLERRHAAHFFPGRTGAENCSVRSRSVMSTTVSIGAVSS